MVRGRGVVSAGLLLMLQGAVTPSLPTVEPNPNRVPAGVLAGDSLVIALDIRMATWYPEESGGVSVDVAAFAEPGRAPEIPGPLIRVPAGTTIIATLHNTLADSSITLYGFVTRPAAADSGVKLAPGERRTVRFAAGVPGTYFYQADVGVQSEEVEREQLAGAFIVDPPGGSPPDRVFVLNIWSGDRLASGMRSRSTGAPGRTPNGSTRRWETAFDGA